MQRATDRGKRPAGSLPRLQGRPGLRSRALPGARRRLPSRGPRAALAVANRRVAYGPTIDGEEQEMTIVKRTTGRSLVSVVVATSSRSSSLGSSPRRLSRRLQRTTTSPMHRSSPSAPGGSRRTTAKRRRSLVSRTTPGTPAAPRSGPLDGAVQWCRNVEALLERDRHAARRVHGRPTHAARRGRSRRRRLRRSEPSDLHDVDRSLVQDRRRRRGRPDRLSLARMGSRACE